MGVLKQNTIFDIIERIESKEILLPSMQRKFVWEEGRIIKFFDSIMKGYPFGDFIFWNIKSKDEISSYKFYEFIKNYSERESTINSSAGKVGKSEIDVVMDGQQRLTSLYIGIKGSIETKLKYKSYKKPENYIKKYLYFKPCISDEDRGDEDIQFKFELFSKESAEQFNKSRPDSDKYYLVSDFYNMTKSELRTYLNVGRIPTDSANWMNRLDTLRRYLNEAEILNCHTISNTNIRDVLEIFVRINSGGKELSKSNLLFSTIITSWEAGRDEMDSFIKLINSDGIIYLKEETLILACIYLINKTSALKLEVLTPTVVKEISDNWAEIKNAVIHTKNFLKDHNLTYEVIKSYNSLLPIMYYFYYAKSMSKDVEQEFVKYFVVSQLFSLFSGSSATTLDHVREALCVNNELGNINKAFRFSNLFGIDLSAGRTNAFHISKEQIERLIDDTKYGDSKAYLIMCLLYPNIKVNLGDFDLDHVCSKDELNKFIKKIRKDKVKKQYRIDLQNGIPNLQLLESGINRGEKNDATLCDWIKSGNKVKFDPYLGHPSDDYKFNSFDEFEEFYKGRRDNILEALCNEMDVKKKKK